MRIPSESELRELGRRFDVEVDDEELAEVQAQVARNLEGLDAVAEAPLGDGDASDVGARSWREPTDDPYNAVAVECEVGPKPDHSGALSGVEVGVKDIIAVAGVPMQCGSAAMRGNVPATDATVVERLRAAGSTITAKTNLDEFAGGSRAVSADGQMRNPHNEDHVPGGSSGGSAIAVATGRVDVALGTDTGGSVRMPSSHCGIVGLKPTYGLVPLDGVVENTYTLDHVGPMATSVSDAAGVLDAIAGKDRTDPASMQAAGRDDYGVGGYREAAESPPDLTDVTLAVVEEGLGEGAAEQPVEEGVAERTETALDHLADAGADVRRVSIDAFELAGPVKHVRSYAELAAHWRDGGAPYRRGGHVDPYTQASFARATRAASAEVNGYYRSRLLAGAQLIEAHGGRHYTRALAASRELKAAFDEAADAADALVTPTMPSTAPTVEDARQPGFDYARNVIPANVTERPAISLPNGTLDGLPVGLQLIGNPFDERRLLGVAAVTADVVG
ncbi:amidase [Halorussus sp. AFM4]|uniref:amidase n=1 Tax=Halorussus sp. AFM4 TaxID=3421651 RepID=UPI003EBE4D1D